MKPPVHLLQPASGHMRINLGCADVCVPEQFLDHPQIRAMLHRILCRILSACLLPAFLFSHAHAQQGPNGKEITERPEPDDQDTPHAASSSA